MTKRIGVHLGTAGGASNAVQKAREIGANTFQFFSSSPRMWRAPKVDPKQAERMRELRAALDVDPLVIHTSYLVNVCSQTDEVRAKSIDAFRGEIERALDLWRGIPRSPSRLMEGPHARRRPQARSRIHHPRHRWPGLAGNGFHILIENTAGAEFSLGGSFEQVAELVTRLKVCAPVAVCLDTCHTHVAGYDLVSDEGYAATIKLIGATVGFDAVRVWHCNDAKAARGSKLDRHQHIGQGTMGVEPFRRILNDKRFAHAAFIAETPVDEPGDEERNVRVLKSLVEQPPVAKKQKTAAPRG